MLEEYFPRTFASVFYVRETCSLTLREEIMAESRVLRKMFGPERKEITGNEEGNVMMSFMTALSSNIFQVIESKRMIRAGNASVVWDRRVLYTALMLEACGKQTTWEA
jgi:hypothetical protein